MAEEFKLMANIQFLLYPNKQQKSAEIQRLRKQV